MRLSALYKSVSYLIAGGGIIKLISLATVFLIINHLGAKGFGEYAITIGAVSLVGVPYRTITGQLFQIELARLLGGNYFSLARKLQKRYLGYTILLSCLILSFVGLIIFSSRMVDVLSAHTHYSLYFIFGSIILILNGIKGLAVSTNRSLGQFKEQAQWDLIEYIVRFLLISSSMMMFSNHFSVPVLLLADCLAIISGWLIFRFILRVQFFIEHQKTLATALPKEQSLKRHTLWFFFRLLVVEFTSNMRLWLLAAFLSIEIVGVFSAAKRVMQAGKIFLPFGVLLNSFIPRNSMNELNLLRAYKRGIRISIFLSVCVVGLILAINVSAIPFVFPSMGSELQYMIFILSFVYIFKACSHSVNSMLGLDREYKLMFLIVCCTFISMLITLPFLIHQFGLYGAALEAIINNMIAFLISYFVLKNKRPLFLITLRDIKHALSLRNFLIFLKLLRT